MRHESEQTITIRRSPAVLVKTIVFVEFLALAAFLAAQPLAYYKDIYNRYVYSQFLPFGYNLVFTVSVALFEIALTVYLFLRWYAQVYRIDAREIVHERGTIFRRHTSLPTSRISSVSFSQGFLGSLLAYGTVTLRAIDTTHIAQLRGIPHPQKYAELITNLVRRKNTEKPSVGVFEAPDLDTLLACAEHERLEFKSTLRWDFRLGRVNRGLEKAAMRTVDAFLNSAGGCLVIGVDDEGRLTGIEDDCQTLQRKDHDGFENHFTQAFRSMIGAEFRHLVKLYFHEREGKHICVAEVHVADAPAYLVGEGKEEFYIRTGNTTTALSLREAHAYIADRWETAAGRLSLE